MQTTNLKVAAKAVIFDNHKVLIVREASTYEEGTNIGTWGLPGGRSNASSRVDERCRSCQTRN